MVGIAFCRGLFFSPDFHFVGFYPVNTWIVATKSLHKVTPEMSTGIHLEYYHGFNITQQSKGPYLFDSFVFFERFLTCRCASSQPYPKKNREKSNKRCTSPASSFTKQTANSTMVEHIYLHTFRFFLFSPAVLTRSI